MPPLGGRHVAHSAGAETTKQRGRLCGLLGRDGGARRAGARDVEVAHQQSAAAVVAVHGDRGRLVRQVPGQAARPGTGEVSPAAGAPGADYRTEHLCKTPWP
ncbi:hypothetical protein Ssi03_06060 [Sphaerisporangium siamense]|nr:hypothetical protein Ssi03_06060 [Sphaerisporangium siamense]